MLKLYTFLPKIHITCLFLYYILMVFFHSINFCLCYVADRPEHIWLFVLANVEYPMTLCPQHSHTHTHTHRTLHAALTWDKQAFVPCSFSTLYVCVCVCVCVRKRQGITGTAKVHQLSSMLGRKQGHIHHIVTTHTRTHTQTHTQHYKITMGKIIFNEQTYLT